MKNTGSSTLSDLQTGLRNRKCHGYTDARQHNKDIPPEGAEHAQTTKTSPDLPRADFTAMRHLIFVSIPHYFYVFLHTLYYYISFIFQHKCEKTPENAKTQSAEYQHVPKKNIPAEKAKDIIPKENITKDAEDQQVTKENVPQEAVLKRNRRTKGAGYHQIPSEQKAAKGVGNVHIMKENTLPSLAHKCVKMTSSSAVKGPGNSACKEVGNIGTTVHGAEKDEVKDPQPAKGNIETEQQVPTKDVLNDQQVLRTMFQQQLILQMGKLKKNEMGKKRHTNSDQVSNMISEHDGDSDMWSSISKHEVGTSSMMWSNTSKHDNGASSMVWSNISSYDHGASSIIRSSNNDQETGASMMWSNDQGTGDSNMGSNTNNQETKASSMMWSNTTNDVEQYH